MLYTLDTNVISAILNSNSSVLNNISKALKRGDTIMLNAICYFESLVREHQILPLDMLALNQAINIYQTLRSNGKLLEDADILVGAIALANNATLVTRNTKHLKRIDKLKLKNWEDS